MKTLGQQLIFSIVATIIVSLVYYIVMDWLRRNRKEKEERGEISLFLIKKVLGFLLLGLVPAVIAWWLFRFGPMQAGLVWNEAGKMWTWIAGASIFFILLNLFNSRNTQIRNMYPELRTESWGAGKLLMAGSGWILYLAGYEYLFRGILLFSCLEAFGYWPAIVINLVLYFILHLPKGIKESLATIPFGALICYLTLESQSIIPAIIIHAVQAISCEMACIWRNPEMKFNLVK